ncbi:efflux RND transporter periplasmic adaptor subunit [Desulfomonile tiedjei]|uniref:RND family efflux transporter, MFP subunit n=1 Tax=Desulfomonile tiedjei (strain ATCC 49306 / DSM 6799 / DCB-1) TaxID=706587 RepID=I4CA15_DESTA|nr:efflux RND transporter periplasmic adaptor subunit [Desulfomonile tiedjei]AFM26406.1 RND family efflux transporter, MFP subunit [Desulfomonile tiedjei DSM 6799]
MKRAIIVLVIIAALVGIYFVYNGSSKEEPEVKYMTAPVQRGTLKAEITSSGTLKPLVEVLVGSQVSGTIKTLYADFESEVKKDQLVALIDPDTYAAKVEQAKADLMSAQANLVKSEVTLEDELRTLARKETLIGKSSISQQEYDAAKTKADAAKAQVLVDKAKVSQAEAKLKEAELQLRYTRIEAPVDGIVVARNMDVGQTVTASFQTPVLFKIAEDLTRMQVHTNVDEADIGRVKTGQLATFTVPAFPDTEFAAEVTQIRNDPKIEQNVVTYNVILDVENKDLRLRPGMTANVRIRLTEVPEALIVPDQALRFIPSESIVGPTNLPELKPGERRLWKLENGNNIKPILVKVGIVGIEGIQIFTNELKAGDKVVVEASVRKKTESQSRGLRFRF